ncbi:MAG: DNA-directed RNA polymerase subunit alpha [Candidatus Moraniibacteriota bacterium]|nr:MAG: DNA-directed RNA polymerase subunit alpha [Candidatus Moranbacteria bacterium]
MKYAILPPQKVEYHEDDQFRGSVEIVGCYPGYGSTLGNALRRVLLSSLEGAAAVSIKISGVQHEFSTIEHVREDIIQILLNMKRVRFQVLGEESVKVSVKVKGEKVVTAGDIKVTSDIKVVNPDQVIATLTDKKAQFEMEIEVRKGLGYVPVEQQDRPEKEIGVIAIDAIFTPVKRVNFTVDNVRVGKRTDYERVRLDIETDGVMTPKEAFDRSVEILVEQFQSLISPKEEK